VGEKVPWLSWLEHPTVNREVAGSSPAGTVIKECLLQFYYKNIKKHSVNKIKRIHSSAVEHTTADRPVPCSNQGVSL
jgi:hypothetical protein